MTPPPASMETETADPCASLPGRQGDSAMAAAVVDAPGSLPTP